MTGRVLYTSDVAGRKLSGDDALAAGLTADNEFIRVMARGTAAGWLEGFLAWVSAEINRPSCDQAAILHAIASLQIQTIGSVAAQLLGPDGDREFIEALVDTTERKLPEHMTRMRAALEQEA